MRGAFSKICSLGSMASYKRMLFLVALAFCYVMMTNANTMLPSETMAEVIVPLETVESSQFCKICKRYASEALSYLSEDKTQTEVKSALYLVCSKMDYLKQQCITLVDQYVPLFFKEIEDISPKDFCDKVKLCKEDVSQSVSIVEGDIYKSIMKDSMPTETKKGSQWCEVCEKVATDALSYLEKNETETEIVTFLVQDCAKLHNFEEECVALVHYYSPLLFSEIEKISPEKFCEKIHICMSDVSIAANIRDKIEQFNEDTCSMCEEVAEQIAIKLNDPETQLEILQILLKGCSKAENYVQKCKRLVLQYTPLFLAKLVKFLETNDVCTMIHACKASKQNFYGDVGIASA